MLFIGILGFQDILVAYPKAAPVRLCFALLLIKSSIRKLRPSPFMRDACVEVGFHRARIIQSAKLCCCFYCLSARHDDEQTGSSLILLLPLLSFFFLVFWCGTTASTIPVIKSIDFSAWCAKTVSSPSPSPPPTPPRPSFYFTQGGGKCDVFSHQPTWDPHCSCKRFEHSLKLHTNK